MKVFLPKLFQWKSKENPSFKCVGTNDENSLASDCDTMVSYPSFSDNNEDVENCNSTSDSIDPSLVVVNKVDPFPGCCSTHLMESAYRHYEQPSKKELTNRRLNIYFKKYFFKPVYHICQAFTKVIKYDEIKSFENVISQKSLKSIAYKSPIKFFRLPQNKIISNCINELKVEKPIYSTSVEKDYINVDNDFKNIDIRSCDTGCSGNMSRNPSRVTTRSSQDIYYSVKSTNTNAENYDDVSSSKSGKSKTLTSTTSSFTSCLNTSSKSYCEEIEKLKLNSSANSTRGEQIASSKYSLNWTLTSSYDSSFIPTSMKSKDHTESESKYLESDNYVTSLTERPYQSNQSQYDFTKITNLSNVLITSQSDVTVVSSIENYFANKICSNKKLSNDRFEKYLAIIKCAINDLSTTDSSEWSLSRSSKSTNNSVSKLPRRKFKKSSSTCVTDLGSLDLCTCLSSLDKSESR